MSHPCPGVSVTRLTSIYQEGTALPMAATKSIVMETSAKKRLRCKLVVSSNATCLMGIAKTLQKTKNL
jgi:hypothetical protein